MPEAELTLADRIRAGLLAVLLGDTKLAADVFTTAEAVSREADSDAVMRAAGLDVAPEPAASVITRGAVIALASPTDRPRLRRAAHRVAALAGVDEGAVIATVATAVLASDFARGFDLSDCLIRCHQTLLEEAPSALLTRLRPLADDASLDGDSDPTVALQVAITALHRREGVAAVAELFNADEISPRPARTLALLLAGLRDGLAGLDISRLDSHSLHGRALAAAQAFGPTTPASVEAASPLN